MTNTQSVVRSEKKQVASVLPPTTVHNEKEDPRDKFRDWMVRDNLVYGLQQTGGSIGLL
jgi:hypothetical protein